MGGGPLSPPVFSHRQGGSTGTVRVGRCPHCPTRLIKLVRTDTTLDPSQGPRSDLSHVLFIVLQKGLVPPSNGRIATLQNWSRATRPSSSGDHSSRGLLLPNCLSCPTLLAPYSLAWMPFNSSLKGCAFLSPRRSSSALQPSPVDAALPDPSCLNTLDSTALPAGSRTHAYV